MILKNFRGKFSPVCTWLLGTGIDGIDLQSEAELAFGFDYKCSGPSNYVTLCESGTGISMMSERRYELGLSVRQKD